MSGGHLYKVEAPTEPAGETVDFAKQKSEGFKLRITDYFVFSRHERQDMLFLKGRTINNIKHILKLQNSELYVKMSID